MFQTTNQYNWNWKYKYLKPPAKWKIHVALKVTLTHIWFVDQSSRYHVPTVMATNNIQKHHTISIPEIMGTPSRCPAMISTGRQLQSVAKASQKPQVTKADETSCQRSLGGSNWIKRLYRLINVAQVLATLNSWRTKFKGRVIKNGDKK